MKSIILTLAATLATATAAMAHSKAEETTPADGATVEIVDVIALRFDDPMRVTAITLTGQDGDLEITRETGLDPVTEFRALPPEAIPAGTPPWTGEVCLRTDIRCRAVSDSRSRIEPWKGFPR